VSLSGVFALVLTCLKPFQQRKALGSTLSERERKPGKLPRAPKQISMQEWDALTGNRGESFKVYGSEIQDKTPEDVEKYCRTFEKK
jgi:hypothetical protein